MIEERKEKNETRRKEKVKRGKKKEKDIRRMEGRKKSMKQIVVETGGNRSAFI